MNDRPREGARWGNDPAPEEPANQAPSKYQMLCDNYGEANVRQALEHIDKLFIDYPALPIKAVPKIEIAEFFIRTAIQNMRTALDDGRPHTMPETLDIISKYFGSYASSSNLQPAAINDHQITVNYGDEQQGNAEKERAYNAAQAAKKKLEEEQANRIKIFFAVVFLSFIAGGAIAGPEGALAFPIVAAFFAGLILFGGQLS